jgi:fructose-1,6-bisphosphatase/inositol monophosphatase family enzyme
VSTEKRLFELLKDFAVFAGKLALPYYGKIDRQNKTIKIAEILRESPVTVVDHGIQEMVLSELIRNNFTNLAFNGEEETHLKFFFKGDYSNGLVVHCDPIDGTKAFVNGKNRFAVGFALSKVKNNVHDFFATIVYSPIDNQLFWSYEDKVSPHAKNSLVSREVASVRLLTTEGKEFLSQKGYLSAPPESMHASIIDTALGNCAAVTGYHVEAHDAFIPFSFAQNYGLTPYTNDGKKMKKIALEPTSKGYKTIHKVYYFANDQIRDELMPIFQNPKYANK